MADKVITLEAYNALKAKVDKLKSKSDQSKGAYTQVMAQLSSEFDCDDLTEAQALLDKLTAQLKKADSKLAKKLATFQKDWADVLADC